MRARRGPPPPPAGLHGSSSASFPVQKNPLTAFPLWTSSKQSVRGLKKRLFRELPHVRPCLFSLACETPPMILSCVDGAPPFMPDESITPALSAASLSTLISAGALGSAFPAIYCKNKRRLSEQLCQAERFTTTTGEKYRFCFFNILACKSQVTLHTEFYSIRCP